VAVHQLVAIRHPVELRSPGIDGKSYGLVETAEEGLRSRAPGAQVPALDGAGDGIGPKKLPVCLVHHHSIRRTQTSGDLPHTVGEVHRPSFHHAIAIVHPVNYSPIAVHSHTGWHIFAGNDVLYGPSVQRSSRDLPRSHVGPVQIIVGDPNAHRKQESS